MATTTNLGITKVEAAQFQKEVTMNTALDTIDKVLAGKYTYNMASDANYTVSDSNSQNRIIIITDTGVVLTTTRDITIDNLTKDWIVENRTAQSLVFKTAGGAGTVTVTSATIRHIYGDGTSIFAVA